MAWRNRLRDLILAGGALAVAGCSSSLPGGGGMAGSLASPCGNANPDPCICGRPDANATAATQCDQKLSCEADGGTWIPWYSSVDGAQVDPHCDAQDGGVD